MLLYELSHAVSRPPFFTSMILARRIYPVEIEGSSGTNTYGRSVADSPQAANA